MGRQLSRECSCSCLEQLKSSKVYSWVVWKVMIIVWVGSWYVLQSSILFQYTAVCQLYSTHTYAPLNCYRLQVFGQIEVLKSVSNHQLFFSHLDDSVSVFRNPCNLDNIRLPGLFVVYANQRAFSYTNQETSSSLPRQGIGLGYNSR